MRRDCLPFLFSFSEVGDDVRYWVFVSWVSATADFKIAVKCVWGIPKYTSSIVSVSMNWFHFRVEIQIATLPSCRLHACGKKPQDSRLVRKATRRECKSSLAVQWNSLRKNDKYTYSSFLGINLCVNCFTTPPTSHCSRSVSKIDLRSQRKFQWDMKFWGKSYKKT